VRRSRASDATSSIWASPVHRSIPLCCPLGLWLASRCAPWCRRGHRLAAATGPLGPEDFDGLPVISYHPVEARYFHELTVRFLFNGHAQHVQQILTAVLLVAAGEGVALVPASATALRVDGVVYKPLTDIAGGHPDSDPARPVELHAIWPRGNLTPMLRKVLHLVQRSAEHLDDLIS